MANRQKAEAFILQYVKDLDPSGYNTEQWKKIFAEMSDKDFDDYMKKIRAGEATLVIFKPMYKVKELTEERALAVAKKYSVPIFERLRFRNDPNVPNHMSTIEYLVLDLPYRRQSQNVTKKISVPDDNKVIDHLSYQPTGASKGAKVSFPELQVLIGMGLDHTIEELTRFRGGDRGGFAAYNASMMRYGSVNLKSLNPYTTGVESTRTLKTLFLSAHLQLEA